jgi:hypothetical protein
LPTTACAFHGDTSTSSSTLHGTYSIVCCARSSRTQPQACSSSTLTCTLLRFFIQTLCRSGPIPRPSGVWLQNPCGGTKCACFRDCARVFWGGCPCYFLRGKRYFGVCATTFSANRAGICTHVAGQAAYIQGKRRAKKIHYRHTRRVGRSYVALRSVLLFWGFFIGNIGVASKGSVLLRFRPQPSNLGSILGTNLSSKQN